MSFSSLRAFYHCRGIVGTTTVNYKYWYRAELNKVTDFATFNLSTNLRDILSFHTIFQSRFGIFKVEKSDNGSHETLPRTNL